MFVPLKSLSCRRRDGQRPASMNTALAPACWASVPAAAVPTADPVTTAVESQENTSVAVPLEAALSAIA